MYAKWTGNQYTITFNKQSGTGGTSSATATYGSAMPSITAPTRTCYTFGGYYTSTGGSGTQYYTATGASARNYDQTAADTLYAKWTSDTDGGTWGACTNYTSINSSKVATGTSTNTCGATRSCTTSCTYQGYVYTGDYCGYIYKRYKCGSEYFDDYYGYSECTVLPDCYIYMNPTSFSVNSTAGAQIYGVCTDTSIITSTSWSGFKRGNGAGKIVDNLISIPSGVTIGTTSDYSGWNTISLRICSSDGCVTETVDYYVG